MRAALDIDGTVDADPSVFASLMSALQAAGHQVVILTGCSEPVPTQKDLDEKAQYLNSIGQGTCWDLLVVFGDPPHKSKARWIRDHHVDVLFDNSAENAELASKYCLALVPWNSMIDAKRKVVHDEGT